MWSPANRQTDVIVQRVMLFRCSSRGLCVAHPPVLLLNNVGYHHSESVEDCAAEIGEELFVVAARFPWFNPVEAVCSVLSCSCFAHGSIVMSVAYVTTIFHNGSLAVHVREGLESPE